MLTENPVHLRTGLYSFVDVLVITVNIPLCTAVGAVDPFPVITLFDLLHSTVTLITDPSHKITSLIAVDDFSDYIREDSKRRFSVGESFI